MNRNQFDSLLPELLVTRPTTEENLASQTMKNETTPNTLSLNGFSILPHWYTDKTIYIPSNPQINLLEKTMIENGIFHLTISQSQDIVYEDNNVDFLEKLTDLVIGIDIFLRNEIDLKAINHLHKLESIEIPLKRMTKIDFSNEDV